MELSFDVITEIERNEGKATPSMLNARSRWGMDLLYTIALPSTVAGAGATVER